MSEELKPCPFCGGEALFETYGGTACAVVCQTCHCGTATARLYDGMEAVKAWNRRAERTCRDIDHMGDAIKCSECGETTLNTLYWVDLDNGLSTVTSHRPRFCSNCGAKVTDE